MKLTYEVENIKCGGCANTISSKIKAFKDVTDVLVTVEDGTVIIEGNAENREQYAEGLAKLGYPEVGSVQGLKSAGAKAKSFVSCAVGKINN